MTTQKLAAQLEELLTAQDSFVRMPNSGSYRSTRYPNHVIMANVFAAPNALDSYMVFRNGEPQHFTTSADFRCAVAAIMADVKATDIRTEADFNRAASEAHRSGA